MAQLLEQNGWIQARLASAIAEHYERSMISQLEAGGATLHLDALVKVAQALDVSIDYLMGLTEDPFPADDRSRSSSSGLPRMPLSGPTDPEGGSTNIESLPVIDLFAFRCEWLETRGSAAESCSAIEVPDDSMEPTLQAGASILVDHRRTRRQGNGVFALHVGDEFGTLRLRSTSPSIPGLDLSLPRLARFR